MPIDMYYIDGSPPCMAVFLLGKTLDIKFNLKKIDYEKGEHKSAEFRKINPQHAVPVINDNGFIVNESRAILGYLVDQYAKDDSLYPKDVKKRTEINKFLFFDIGSLYQGFLDYYCALISTGKVAGPEKLETLKDAFQVFNTYLEGKEWITGKNITIADYSLLLSVASNECCGFDVTQYPNVFKWFTKAKKTVPSGILEKGIADLKAFFDQFVK